VFCASRHTVLGHFDHQSRPIGDLRVKRSSLGFHASTYPYVAPHTAKIHTLITLGIRHRAKALAS
jgi:hypothetical protein